MSLFCCCKRCPKTPGGHDSVGSVVRYRVLVSGRVQGVFFRDTCRQVAEEHDVSGWVRNLPDGRVEAVFEGLPESVDRLVTWTRSGPSEARVTGAEPASEFLADLC